MNLSEAFLYSKKNKKRLIRKKLAIIGVAYDPSSHAPFMFFKIEFDPNDEIEVEGAWYALEYQGGSINEGGYAECDNGNGGSTLDEALNDALEDFPILNEVVFTEMQDVDLDRSPQYVLPDLFHEIPDPDDFWPSRMKEFTSLCIDAINFRNEQINERSR